jgi:hypothetical protein
MCQCVRAMMGRRGEGRGGGARGEEHAGDEESAQYVEVAARSVGVEQPVPDVKHEEGSQCSDKAAGTANDVFVVQFLWLLVYSLALRADPSICPNAAAAAAHVANEKHSFDIIVHRHIGSDLKFSEPLEASVHEARVMQAHVDGNVQTAQYPQQHFS